MGQLIAWLIVVALAIKGLVIVFTFGVLAGILCVLFASPLLPIIGLLSMLF